MKKIIIGLIIALFIPNIICAAKLANGEEQVFKESIVVNGVEYVNFNTVTADTWYKNTKMITSTFTKCILGVSFMKYVLSPLANQTTDIITALHKK